jgi:serine protease Do
MATALQFPSRPRRGCRCGVKNGDVILEAGGRKVTTAVNLRNAIDAAEKSGRHYVLLHVKTGNEVKFVV